MGLLQHSHFCVTPFSCDVRMISIEGEWSLFLEPIYFPHTLDSDFEGCAGHRTSVSFYDTHSCGTSSRRTEQPPPTPVLPAPDVLCHMAGSSTQSALLIHSSWAGVSQREEVCLANLHPSF